MFVLITSVFTIYLITEPVQAQGIDLCCERTISGESCRFTDSSQCDNSFATSASTCDQTSFCEVGCCSIQTAGVCNKGSPKSSCEAQGGDWSNNPQCNIQECQLGCCVLGNQYQFITETACQKLYEPFPQLPIDFRDDISTEAECTELSLSGQQGCCVDQNTCSYGSRDDCVALTGSSSNFNNNKFCSELTACSGICTSQDHKECIQGQDDVYWFDSCGNPEGKAEECSILDATVCGQDDNDEFTCISTDCVDDESNSRKNGESWCEFDTFEFNGQPVKSINTPGSRHYIRSCINGRILREECADFRTEICLEKKENGKSLARCLPAIDDIKQLIGVNEGIKFWEDGVQNSCSDANKRKSWKGEVETQPFVDERAIICMNQGDCGADYNWAGDFNSEGYHNTCGREQNKFIIQNHLSILERFDNIEGIDIYSKDIFTKEGILEFFRVTNTDTLFADDLSIALTVVSILFPVTGWIIAIYFVVKFFAKAKEKTRCTARCQVWQPLSGGEQCSRCTEDSNKPCTEYRCKSLGTTCELVNENTPFVECVDVEPTDVIPPTILPYEDILTDGYTITTYPTGYEINEPIAPYKKVTIGILTKDENGNDELTQCKVSPELGTPYENMFDTFASNGFVYQSEHNTTLTIPAIAIDPQVMSQTNGEFNLYIKCQDKSGNSNQDDFIIQFEVLPEPDGTPPLIELYNPPTNSQIPAINETTVTIYTNEPADCKYSDIDESYDLMPNGFEICAEDSLDISQASINGALLYECTTTMTNLKHDQNNIYYFRCKDQPQETDESIKNTNQQSFLYTLIPSDPLEITSKGPEGDIFNNQITLTIETSNGGDQGNARCGYRTDTTSSYIQFFDTGTDIHEQQQTLNQGSYTYYIQCVDAVGNIVEDQIDFTVSIDNNPPEVLNILPKASQVELILNEPATCKYSNQEFSFDTGGTLAQQDSAIQNFPLSEEIFIRCQDTSNNELSLTLNP